MKNQLQTTHQNQAKSGKYHVNVLKERCKGCDFCIEFCPRHTLHKSETLNLKGYYSAYAETDNDCPNCGLCELICPEFAIYVTPFDEGEVDDKR
ncbi:ferredoxin family protein [Chloroflexota bacterium]